MRSEQIVGWLICGLLTPALATLSGSVDSTSLPGQTGFAHVVVNLAQKFEWAAGRAATEPLAQVRRVALLIPRAVARFI